jgi:hypothetical protein
MEVMVPVMTTGMVVSMWVAMEAAMAPIPILEGARMGVYGGIATLFACYAANALIRGRTSHWIS